VKKCKENGKTTGKCECSEFEHTGFPCGHVCLLNYKGLVEEMSIHPRWWKTQGKQTGETSKSMEEEEDEVSCLKLSGKKNKKPIILAEEEETSMEESETIKVN